MYCPKCMSATDHGSMGLCPNCAAPLADIPAPLSTGPVGHKNGQSPENVHAAAVMPEGIHAAHADASFHEEKEEFFSLENGARFNKQAEEADSAEQDILHASVFGQKPDSKTNSPSTEDTIFTNVRPRGSTQHQSPSHDLLENAFEEFNKNDQRAHSPRSKSLAITALLGGLIVLSCVAAGIYYHNHTTERESFVQAPSRTLTLPSSDSPSTTLKNTPHVEQQSQLADNQTTVQNPTGQTSHIPEPKDGQDKPPKEAHAADTSASQQRPAFNGEASAVAPAPAPPTAELQALPQEDKKTGPGTLAPTQSGSVGTSASGPAIAKRGSHILLCGSFKSKEKALKLAAKIKAKGYIPSVEKADLGGQGVWYRLKIAGFSSKDAAEKARVELNKKLKLAAIVSKRT